MYKIDDLANWLSYLLECVDELIPVEPVVVEFLPLVNPPSWPVLVGLAAPQNPAEFLRLENKIRNHKSFRLVFTPVSFKFIKNVAKVRPITLNQLRKTTSKGFIS